MDLFGIGLAVGVVVGALLPIGELPLRPDARLPSNGWQSQSSVGYLPHTGLRGILVG